MVKRKRNKTKKIHSRSKKSKIKQWHAVPLKGSFMLTAILGLLISIYWVYPQSSNYGVTFVIILGAMFIASMISMTKAPIINQ